MMDFIINYWLEFVFSLIITCLSYSYHKLKKSTHNQELTRDGVVALLHDKLYQAGADYIPKGEITLDELKNIEYLYEAYHNLGGNGTGTEIFNRIKSLKIK